MKKYCFVLMAVTIGFVSCDKDGYKKTDTGLRYKFFVKKDGPKPKTGDIITLNMSYRRSTDDSVLFDTYKMHSPVKLPLQQPSYKGSIEEGFAMMSVGDSASFKVSADSLFLRTFHTEKLPPSIKKGSDIIFTLKLEKIQSEAEVQKEYSDKMEAAKNKEQGEVNQYVKEHNISSTPSATGVYTIVTTQGKGAQAADGKTVKVNYTGRLLNGKVFDTSVESVAKSEGVYQAERKYEPFEFKLGQGQVIPGWEEAIKTMKVGGKSTFIIPSAQAYGPKGAGNVIPPFSPLVFEVELLEVK